MKSLNKMITAILIVSSVPAIASEKGNGGGIHYCPRADKQAEMYDLYEGRARYELSYSNSNKSFTDYLNDGLKKLHNVSPKLEHEVAKHITWLRTGGLKIKEDTKLMPVPDANILMTGEGCTYEQLANWDEVAGKVFVKKAYFDLLDSESEAALYFHEAIYKVGRDQFGLKNSDLVREIVAEIFSDSEPLTSLKKLPLSGGVVVTERPISEGLKLSQNGKKVKAEFHLGNQNFYSVGNVEMKLTVELPKILSIQTDLTKNLEDHYLLWSQGDTCFKKNRNPSCSVFYDRAMVLENDIRKQESVLQLFKDTNVINGVVHFKATESQTFVIEGFSRPFLLDFSDAFIVAEVLINGKSQGKSIHVGRFIDGEGDIEIEVIFTQNPRE